MSSAAARHQQKRRREVEVLRIDCLKRCNSKLWIDVAWSQEYCSKQWLPAQDCQATKITVMRQNDAVVLESLTQDRIIRLSAESQRDRIDNVAALCAKKFNHLRMKILIRQKLAREQVQLGISAVTIVSLPSD